MEFGNKWKFFFKSVSQETDLVLSIISKIDNLNTMENVQLNNQFNFVKLPAFIYSVSIISYDVREIYILQAVSKSAVPLGHDRTTICEKIKILTIEVRSCRRSKVEVRSW